MTARRWRRYFLTGLVVVAPVGVTLAVLWWLFRTLDAILGGPLEQLLGVHVPGLGLLLLFATICATGWVARYAIGRQLIAWWSGVLVRFPLTGRLYGTLAQIAQAIAGVPLHALDPVADDRQRIVDLVREAGRHNADHGEPFRPPHLVLEARLQAVVAHDQR
jgi:hypothetical protein